MALKSFVVHYGKWRNHPKRRAGFFTSGHQPGSQIDQKNRNNRIYTESEYVPQIEALQAKIGASKLLGELDHPAQFDISLKNVSHIIEELTYDKESKEVRGRIKLLDSGRFCLVPHRPPKFLGLRRNRDGRWAAKISGPAAQCRLEELRILRS